MYRTIFVVWLSTTMSLSASTALASQGRGGGPKTKPPTSPAAHGPTTRAPKSHAPKSHVSKNQGPKTHAAKPVPAGHGSPKTTRAASATPHLSPVQQKLQKNTNLAAKLSSRLPAGADLMTASEGFRNLGQFVAAVNVSNNLGIPFTQLKSRMVDDDMSLGQSIQALRPRADYKVEVRRAESDAGVLVRTSNDTTSSKTKKQKSTATTKKRG